MICTTCGRNRPLRDFQTVKRKWDGSIKRKVARYCRDCRHAYAARIAESPRASYTAPRDRGTHPRAKKTHPREQGTNPRALGTNPHPGKSEAAGQWRAAWRRRGQLSPDVLHELATAIERRYGVDPHTHWR